MHCIAQPGIETHPECVPSSSVLRFVLSAVLAAWVLRLIVVAFVYQGFLDPGRDHWEFGFEAGRVAKSIVTGHGFSNPFWAQTGPTAWLAPVYPYLLAGVFVLFGIQTKAAALAILSLNSLFSALTCLPVFFIAKRTLGLRVAKLAIWLWAFFPYAIYFSADSTWDHSLLALMTPTLFLISLHLEDAAGIWPWIGFGLFYGVATLTSPVVLAVLPVLLGWPCYRRWRAGGSYSLSGFSAVLALLVITVPWIVRNYRTFGHPVFFKDNLWVEVCVGNIGNSLHWWNGEFHPAGSEAEAKAFGDLGESAYVAAKRQQALAFLEQHPAKFVGRCARHALYHWTGFWSFDHEYLLQEPLDPWNIFFSSTYTLLLVLGLCRLWRDNRETALLFTLMLLLFPSVYYLTHPEMSYRLPIDAAAGIILVSYWLTSRFTSKRGNTEQANVPTQGEVTQSPHRAEPTVVSCQAG